MKNLILNRIMNSIKTKENYDDIKLAEIRYGLETIYITITKTIVIVGASYFLGTIKELLLILLFYGLLRLTGFGAHAKKSWHCWVSSLLIFLLLPYIITSIEITFIPQIIITSISVLFIFAFAPADTEKRPLINKKKRNRFKILCTLTATAFSIYSFITTNIVIKNAILASLIIECIMISPITYKIFRLKYANYRSYIPSRTASTSA